SCLRCPSQFHGLGRDRAGNLCSVHGHRVIPLYRLGDRPLDDHLHAGLLLYCRLEPHSTCTANRQATLHPARSDRLTIIILLLANIRCPEGIGCFYENSWLVLDQSALTNTCASIFSL